MDTVTKAVRSRIMSRIRSTSMMELAARGIASRKMGCRLLHKPDGVYGRPDYANKSRKVAVFVHGCFFHQPCPRACSRVPASNTVFWEEKFKRNAARHREVERHLRSTGWRVLVIWEHDVRMEAKRS